LRVQRRNHKKRREIIKGRKAPKREKRKALLVI
jgi:hypothetical protein